MTSGTSSSATGAARFADYFELTKPRLSLLSVLTALAGYAAARPPGRDFEVLTCVLAGTCMAAGGVAALNQYLECETDARMVRTANRPIPSGKIASGSAFILGAGLCAASLMLLFIMVNALSALFTLLTIFAYLGLYTPAKKRSRWATEIGAVAGAFPPLIGWAAGEGRISTLGWILFAILYFWQIPHFMAIAWMYRRDYSAVNFPMPSVRDPSGGRVAVRSFVNCVLLVAVSVLPVYLRLDTWRYGVVAAALGVWLLVRAGAFLRSSRHDATAGPLFFLTILYLPALLIALVADRLAFY
ncbi:MAG: heme o synthase [Opitutaceae bacterium]